VANAAPEDIDFIRRAGARRCEEKEEARTARKRKRNDTQNTHCTALRQDADEPRDISKFLDLLAPAQVKSCYQIFYNMTSTSALKSTVCGVCAREVSA
jgi:hypothetical protein